MAVSLGPFQLLRPIGKGGMGVVWLGRHVEQQVDVAVKVITGKIAVSADYQHRFEREVRSVSSLGHPGVVWIFDCGTIGADSARQSSGQLVEGSPCLVMEHACRGTLRELGRLLTWPEMRSILMTLLDALAHAHGVVHRDLKPDNVLIAGSEDLGPGFKITDFGIAHPIVDSP